jgi:hypothetical protein
LKFLRKFAEQWQELSSFYDLPEFDQAFTARDASEVLIAMYGSK